MTLAPAPEAGGAVPAGTTVTPDMQSVIAGAAGASANGTSPPSSTGSTTPTLMQQANAEAQSQINSQALPIQQQITQLQQQGTQQQNAVSAEFQQLLPYSQQQAAYTGAFNTQAANAASSIFQQANQNLNQIAQNSAQQAQQVAQQTGGPVSTATFTDGPMTAIQEAQQQAGDVGQLTTLNLGTIGTDEASQFAGQVLPAMRTEQASTIRDNINSQVDALQQKLATLKGTKATLADAALPKLQQQQLTAKIDEGNLALKKLAQQESWQATNRSLNQKDAELALAQQAQMFSEGIDTAKVNISEGQLALDAQKLTAEDKLAAQKLGLTDAEYVLRAHQYATTDALAQQRLQVQQQSNMRSLIDAAIGGTSSDKPITLTERKFLSPTDPLAVAAAQYSGPTGQGGLGAIKGQKPPSNVYYDQKTGQWYTYVKIEQTPQAFQKQYGTSGSPITDPNALYSLITSNNTYSPKLAIALIRTRLGLPNWKPGQPATPPVTDLAKMSMSQLSTEAESRGWKGEVLTATKQQLIDYIRKSDPSAGR